LSEKILHTNSHFPWFIRALPDGRRAISAGLDFTLRLWDLETGEELRAFRGHTSVVWSVTLLPDGLRVLSSSADGTWRLWNISNGLEIRRFESHSGFDLSVHALWDGRRALSSGASRAFLMWDLRTGNELCRFEGHSQNVTSIASLYDQRHVLSGSKDRTLRLWKLDTGKEIHRFEGHRDEVTSVAVLPDDRALSGSKDLTVRLWSLETGKELHRFEGHTDDITSVALFSDGRRAISGSKDRTLRLWNLVSGTEIQTFVGHSKEVRSISVLPKENGVLSVSGDDTLRKWDIDITRETTGESLTYTTVRIALLGDSGVGKTGLGWRIAHGGFRDQPSSHGQQFFWLINELSLLRDDGTQCEAILWDMAGQSDYRLVHALFLDQVDLGLLLFDPANRERPLSGVEYWIRNLRSATNRYNASQPSSVITQQSASPMLLVAARVDRGTPSLSDSDIGEFCDRNGISHYIATSASEDIGIGTLLENIRASIPWERLTPTTTTRTFKRVKDHLLTLKNSLDQHSILLHPTELRRQLKKSDQNWDFTDVEMMAAVGHLANHGYVIKLRLANGNDAVLLAPDLLANLASSIVLEARRHERGLGSLDETLLLRGSYSLPELANVDKDEGAALLDATVALFLRSNLCFREAVADRTMLVFPSLINQKGPPSLSSMLVEDVSYHVIGAVENAYPALVVQLGYTNLFRRNHHWQNQAQYEFGPGELCTFRQTGEQEGEVEFVLSYSASTDEDTRNLFQGAFERFLRQRKVQIVRYPAITCRGAHRQKRANIRDAIDKGRSTFFCDECGEKISTPRGVTMGQPIGSNNGVLNQAEILAGRRTDYEVAVAWMKAFLRDERRTSGRPLCFLSYSWGDAEHERWVERLAEHLENADVSVLFDRWHNTPGTSIARFIERISTSDFVCAVGTPDYRLKDQLGDDDPVVQAELRLIKTKLRSRDEIRDTIIPILRRGNQKESFPSLFLDSVFIDFRIENEFFLRLFDLVLAVHRVPFENEMVRKHRVALSASQ
jgi:GTPase SAR1 family protein